MSKRFTPHFQPSKKLTSQYEIPSQQSPNSHSENQTIISDLSRLKDINERNVERNLVEPRHYYILEIVRLDTREARNRWGLDGTRNIKCSSDGERIKYTFQKNPVMAKRMSKKEPNLPSNWDEISYDIMMDILRTKFAVPELAEMLEATGDVLLQEGNHWNDNR